MNALTFEHWPVERIVEYARNPRRNDHAVDQMAAAIQEFGFRIPCVVQSDGRLVDGHLRLKAARKLGLATVPVVLADDLTPAQIKAFRLLANRSATWAEWDEDLLRLELEELRLDEFDLSLTGFGEDEINPLLAPTGTSGLIDEDEAPEVDADAVVSQRGDVWLLGRHRLMCGDSTSADDVAALMRDANPHLMVTDPPYGVNYDPAWRIRAMINGPTAANGLVINDDNADWTAAWALFNGDVAYVWHAAGGLSPVVAHSLESCGFDIRMQIIWAKSHFPIGRGHYHVQHEPCWYAVRKGETGHWNGDRTQTTLWQIDKPIKSETGHSTQKPVECMRKPIENNSKPGDTVYEPFSGSGTTIIAAEQTGRACLAMELNPAYVDMAIRRWQAFTGRTASRDSDGMIFDSSADERSRTKNDLG